MQGPEEGGGHMRLAPRMIRSMEVLQTPISELSSQLAFHAVETPELSLLPQLPGTIASDDFDVVLDEDGLITVVEPACGRPLLKSDPGTQNPELRELHWLLEAIDQRRATLFQVTNTILDFVPAFPAVPAPIRMLEVADVCGIHVTTVSRAVDGKLCKTPVGLIKLKDAFGSKKQ